MVTFPLHTRSYVCLPLDMEPYPPSSCETRHLFDRGHASTSPLCLEVGRRRLVGVHELNLFGMRGWKATVRSAKRCFRSCFFFVGGADICCQGVLVFTQNLHVGECVSRMSIYTAAAICCRKRCGRVQRTANPFGLMLCSSSYQRK